MFPSVDTPLTLEVNYLRGVLLLNYNWHIQVNYPPLYPSRLISLSSNKNSHLPLRTPASQRTPQTGDWLPRWLLGLPRGEEHSKPSLRRSPHSLLCFHAFLTDIIETQITLKVSHGYFAHTGYYRAFCWSMKKWHYRVCVSTCGLLLLTWLQEKSKRE